MIRREKSSLTDFYDLKETFQNLFYFLIDFLNITVFEFDFSSPKLGSAPLTEA